MNSRVRMFLLCTAPLVLAGFTRGIGAGAADDLCGTTVTQDLRLDHDLVCTGAGLVIGADDITVNLDGHTITGSGTGVGIRVALRSRVTIKGGTVRNFETGIMVANSSQVIVKNNDVTQTREGIFLNGSTDCVVKDNRSFLNLIRGIMIRPSSTRISTRNDIVANVLTDNPVGILLFGQPGNTFKDNTITGSTTAGILLTSTGTSDNVFKANAISDSAVAVSFSAGWVDNSFFENLFASNGCGLQGTTSGNLFRENTFTNNGADECGPPTSS
jgi:parallel beta-helix repeat protein